MTTVERFDQLRTQEDVRTLYLHELAVETIARMFTQCERIKATFGIGVEYEKACTSLQWCLQSVFAGGFGTESYVTKESMDDIGLTLFVQQGGTYVFGIVWFRDRKYDGTDREGVAGEWSCHS